MDDRLEADQEIYTVAIDNCSHTVLEYGTDLLDELDSLCHVVFRKALHTVSLVPYCFASHILQRAHRRQVILSSWGVLGGRYHDQGPIYVSRLVGQAKSAISRLEIRIVDKFLVQHEV